MAEGLIETWVRSPPRAKFFLIIMLIFLLFIYITCWLFLSYSTTCNLFKRKMMCD